MDRKKIIDSIIRVDHAGEYAATYIYKGQLKVFKHNRDLVDLIQEMELNEQEHLQFFNEKIIERRVRPTIFLPLWKAMSYGLGGLTAILGKKYAMACTVAVEETIGRHYQEQIDTLEKLIPEEHKLKEDLMKIRDDELNHRDTGILHEAKQAKFYNAAHKIISLGCRIAIFLSKKI